MIGIKLSFCILSFLILIDLVVALPDGFCTVEETYIEPVTSIQTYKSTIPYTRKCGFMKHRICYDYMDQINSQLVVNHLKRTRIVQKCCKGFVPMEDKCTPVCYIKCINAQCTEPNKCTCDPGYEPSLHNYRCKPKCDGCNNGTCTGPNKCQCNEGYKYNEALKTCDAVCTIPCLNGDCSKPEICTCFTGYHKNDSEICVENECDPTTAENNDCINGTCRSNGICICNEGFAKNEANHVCQPVCVGCSNGTCIAPNKCLCNNGFDWNDTESKCQPKCSRGCLNGDCVSTENCVCKIGYDAINSSVCVPICNETCVFGTCVAPNKCTCLEGYERQNSSDHVCNPVCVSGCVNGFCIKPDICLCDNGFVFNETSNQCSPICDDECVNADCTAPNMCTCQNGFSKINSTHCEIPCENCTNGYCESENVCQCDIDYHMSDDSKCVQNECSPNLIEDSCENGYCANDGVCVCKSGYVKNDSMSCAPICTLECINGFCSEPEVCQCSDGYELNSAGTNGTEDEGNCTNCTILSNWNVCDPKCDDCLSGDCIKPGRCNCTDGYVEHPNNRGMCIPVAQFDKIAITFNNTTSSSNLRSVWIIVLVIAGVSLCIGAAFAYRRYVRRISYKCNTDIYIYSKDDDDNEL